MSELLLEYRRRLKALADEACTKCRGIDPELGPKDWAELKLTTRCNALYEALALLDELRAK